MTMTGSTAWDEKTAEGEPRLLLRWGRKGRADAGDRTVAIMPGRTPALRLNSDLGVRYRPERLAEVPDNAAKVERLKGELERTLDIFAKHPRQFIEIYFRFIAERIEAEKTALEQSLAWSGGLFGAEDWIFSALRPLPLATVVEPEGQGRDAAPIYDFAFWTGRQVLVVDLQGSAKSRREPDRFLADLVEFITVPVAALASGTEIFAAGDFPAEFSSFWQGDDVPSSPFRPAGLTQRPPV